MRSVLLFSSLLIVVAHCGYPIPEEYPTAPPTYPAPKRYPIAYSAPLPPPPSISAYTSSTLVVDGEVDTAAADYSDDTTSSVDYRRRAKARTAHNRQVHHRRALQPIRRFQKKQ